MQRMKIFLALPLVLAASARGAGINVRITPPDKAQFLQFQTFDIRVEATAADAAGAVTDLTVAIDGIDVTARGEVTSPAPNVRNWTFRKAGLGIVANRVFTAKASGALKGSPITGEAFNVITVRKWDISQTKPQAPAVFPEVENGFQQSKNSPKLMGASEEYTLDNLHLGSIHPAFFRQQDPLAEPARKAKNVILFIGDGMGVAHRTAGRVLSRGYTQGKANKTMAMDRFPYNGLVMTSSLDSLITDSAPGAHCYSTGNKTNNGMEGVFPDNTSDEADNPRVEHLASFIYRNYGKVTGIVSDAFLTDATPAAFLAHTQNRGNGTLIASQYLDEREDNGLKVLMGGGAYHFIPKSQTGSRRTDERNIINEFKGAGWTYVENATQLNGFTPGRDARLLGLFHLDNMDVAFDKLKLGDPSVTASFPDQPFLSLMTRKSIEVLSKYPDGFFLMVEGAHIDKQAHRMDAERSIYDVIQLDQAIQVALDFAMATNSDSDPTNDTLVIVTADHECAGMALPGVGRPDKAGTRDYVKAYNYSDGAVRNDPRTLNFTDYVDADGDGYPDNPDTGRKLIVNFGANSDRYEDWKSNAKPKDPGVTDKGVAVANQNDPDRNSPGALMIPGVVENGANGGDAQTQAVHTLADIPISAYGPGSAQFSRVTDNTEAFFSIINAMLGTYPVPVMY